MAITLVLLPGVAMSVLGQTLPAEEWPFALFWGVIFALPFAYLALATSAWQPWVLTAILSACIWGALMAAVAREEAGVSLWLVLFMVAAPVAITAGAALAVHFTQRHD
ncbi:MAG TPA: hypothetical protein VMK31_00730 [Sphingomicrobium sp.]|nr:hypothetical protein [Sphingomicrobium sp.]